MDKPMTPQDQPSPYVPGLWQCPLCDLRLQTLSTPNDFSYRPSRNGVGPVLFGESDYCPGCRTAMVPVTWETAAREKLAELTAKDNRLKACHEEIRELRDLIEVQKNSRQVQDILVSGWKRRTEDREAQAAVFVSGARDELTELRKIKVAFNNMANVLWDAMRGEPELFTPGPTLWENCAKLIERLKNERAEAAAMLPIVKAAIAYCAVMANEEDLEEGKALHDAIARFQKEQHSEQTRQGRQTTPRPAAEG
ncbi:MAG: hypothetical protein ABI977_16525 [Acidobacteriota bacterium]